MRIKEQGVHLTLTNMMMMMMMMMMIHRVKKNRNIIHTIKIRKANPIGHVLRRNCLLKQVIEGKLEGKIEVTGRRRRRRNLTG